MKPKFSLRSRVLLGAFLWTAGLFAVTGVVTTQVMFYQPNAPRMLHRLFAHSTVLSALALAFMIAGLFQVRGVLAAVNRLRGRLTAVHDGLAPRVAGAYPAEVQPLVDELNMLLAHQEAAVTRAAARAGDLAHGLKTPLALLAHEAERAGAAGQTEIAAGVREQVERMRRQVESHLAHARAAASGVTPGARCAVIESAEGLARTMLRLHADRALAIDVRVPGDHVVRCRREDVDEMLGNLLDNACKWGKSRISIGSVAAGSSIVIQVDDDGSGLDPSKRAVVMQRGVRADEAAPGSGLGLAIVRDLAELYGGAITLDQAASGGLRAELRLPAA